MRASKYRHVYGQAFKKELCYENLKPTLNAFDSNILQCNGKYIALNAAGIGSIIVIPVEETGKAPEKVPYFRGHTGGSVMDTDFDPFKENRFASAGEDGKVLLWDIPEDYTFIHADPANVKDVEPVAKLKGHSRKVGHVKYNPVAEDVLASSAFDYTVKIWNLKEEKCVTTLQHKDLVTSFTWNYNGTKIATTSRDKKLRVWDARDGKILSEGPGHPGAKSSRVVWLGNTDRLLTTGFDKFSERQLALWKADAIEDGAIGGFYSIDSSSGVLMPFYDPSTDLAFIAGKGDGNVRYFEFADDQLYDISEFQSTAPQRGFAVSPKRYVNVKENEIARGYKLLNDNSIEPISFIVPRRSEMFQDDIYPDAPAGVAAQSADEFFSGKTVDGPILISMEDIYEGKDKPETKKTSKLPTKEDVTEAKEKADKELKKAEEKGKKAGEADGKDMASDIKKDVKKDAESDVEKNLTKGLKKSTEKDAKGLLGASKAIESKKEAIVHKIDESIPASGAKGLEGVLKGSKVKGLLNKVNNMSDDDTQDVDGGGEDWEPKKPSETKPKVDKSKTDADLSKAKSDIPKPDAAKAKVEETLSTKSVDKKEELAKAEEVVKAAEKDIAKDSASAITKGRAGGLKATVDKLQTLVTQLEEAIVKLAESSTAKDEQIKVLEDKIDMLLKK